MINWNEGHLAMPLPPGILATLERTSIQQHFFYATILLLSSSSSLVPVVLYFFLIRTVYKYLTTSTARALELPGTSSREFSSSIGVWYHTASGMRSIQCDDAVLTWSSTFCAYLSVNLSCHVCHRLPEFQPIVSAETQREA